MARLFSLHNIGGTVVSWLRVWAVASHSAQMQPASITYKHHLTLGKVPNFSVP